MVDLGQYVEIKPHRRRRVIWAILNATLFRVSPNCIRNRLLRAFGAQIGNSLIYRSVNIYDPANLIVGNFSCVGPHVDLYCKDEIVIGDNSVVSQWAYICTASHDISSPVMALKTRPVVIGNGVWVAAHAKILPGVNIFDGAVVALGSVVTKNVAASEVVGGNPARLLKRRVVG